MASEGSDAGAIVQAARGGPLAAGGIGGGVEAGLHHGEPGRSQLALQHAAVVLVDGAGPEEAAPDRRMLAFERLPSARGRLGVGNVGHRHGAQRRQQAGEMHVIAALTILER
jgi:hypothetical protein